MGGTKKGGLQAYKHNVAADSIYVDGKLVKIKPGEFYKFIGAMGGATDNGKAHLKGFGTNRKLASQMGIKGGSVSGYHRKTYV